MQELKEFLKEKASSFKKDRVYFIGLGNPYRSDDAFGIFAVEKLRKAGFSNAFLESEGLDDLVLKLVKEPQVCLVLFIDAADFKGKVGELKIFSSKDLPDELKSSHQIPLKLYLKLLEDSGKVAYLLCLKPQSLKETLKPALSKKAETSLADLISFLQITLV